MITLFTLFTPVLKSRNFDATRIGSALTLAALVVVLTVLPAQGAWYGDPAGAWAVVDKVVFEPNAQQP